MKTQPKTQPKTPKKQVPAGLFPTPDETPDAKRLNVNKEKDVFVPKFRTKRSFDLTGDVEALEPAKRQKLDTSRMQDELHEIDHNDDHEDDEDDLDSEASTEVASEVEGEFLQSQRQSEDEHSYKQEIKRQRYALCMTPEKPKSKKDLILTSSDLEQSHMLTGELNKDLEENDIVKTPTDKVVGTPKFISNIDLGTSQDEKRQRRKQDFDPSKELLLVDKSGKVKYTDIDDGYQPQNLIDVLRAGGEESYEDKEARLIKEAEELDKNGFSKSELYGNNSGDEGFSENEMDPDESISNYFQRMRQQRKNKYRMRYSSDEEAEEEEYLKRLLSKGKSKVKVHDEVKDSGDKLVREQKEEAKNLRKKNKDLMKNEDLMDDNYMNFGFTLGELYQLRKNKKILVFEDPKNEDEE